MKLVQLLTGTAAAALLAGASFAQEPTVATGNAAGAAPHFEGQKLPSELDAVALSGDLIINFADFVDDNGTPANVADDSSVFAGLGAGGNIEVTVTLSNATFSSTVPATAWTDPTDADCAMTAPTLGGGAGGNSVTFEGDAATSFNNCNGNDQGAPANASNANDGFLTLPIEVTNFGQPVTATVTFAGDGVDDDQYTGSVTQLSLLTFDSALGAFTATPGAVGAGLFDQNGDDLSGSGIIGVVAGPAAPVGFDVDLEGTALANIGDIADTGELTITFPSGATGIDAANVDLNATACAQQVAPNDNQFVCSLNNAAIIALEGGSSNITIDDDADANTSITAQTPSVALSLTAAAGFSATGGEFGATNIRNLDLDDGVTTYSVYANGAGTAAAPLANPAPFGWTSLRAAGGTKSAFRISGLEAQPTEIAVVVDEVYARTGATAPASARAVIANADVQEDPLNAGEYIATFTSEDLATALGTDGGINADVSFEIVLPDGTATSIVARRLLSTNSAVAGTGFDG